MERDVHLLKMLYKNGVLSNEQIREMYGHTSSYYKKRLTQLSKERYLIRDNGYVRITSKGIAEIGIVGIPKKLRRKEMKRRVEVLNAVRLLPEWEVLLSVEIKKKKGLNKSSHIDAYIEKDGIGYAVYMVDAKTIRPVTLGRLWNEMQEMPLKGINRVMVLFEHAAAMSQVASKVEKPRMEELLLLPYPSGIDLFNAYCSEGFKDCLSEKLPGLEPLDSARKFADYQWQGNYVSVLVTNDAVKRYYLGRYYNGLSYQAEKKDIVIVCAGDQRVFFANLYPLAKIVALGGDSLTCLRSGGSAACCAKPGGRKKGGV